MIRQAKILASIDRSMRVLELGPLTGPIAPKANGWFTSVVDHTDREGLVDKYRSDPNVDTSRIEDVDFVWSRGPLTDAIPQELHGTFDAVIASHVLEHIPDPIGLLQSVARILRPAGVVSLVIPDKRFCFDFFKPLSAVGELLEAHARRAERHSRKARFDYEAYSISADGEFAFSRRPIRHISFFVSLHDAKRAFDTHASGADGPYADIHAWHFTPSSFELAVLELSELELIDFSVERSFPPEGCEFYVTLRNGRARYVGEEELQLRRLQLLRKTFDEVREQTELMNVDCRSDPQPIATGTPPEGSGERTNRARSVWSCLPRIRTYISRRC